jgi:hypothetical protein
VEGFKGRSSGYADPLYCESLDEFGKPRQMDHCGGSILVRNIPGSKHVDAIGPYPIFSCRDLDEIGEDLRILEKESNIVSISLVTDPLSNFDEDLLKTNFSDRFHRFKSHFIVDLRKEIDTYISSHHSRYSKKSMKSIKVERIEDPLDYLDEWVDLYTHLVERHDIKGIQAFSEKTFEKQFTLPGLISYRAVLKGETVGIVLYFSNGKNVYYHLGAYNKQGYEEHASYSIFYNSILDLGENGHKRLSLGGSPGINNKDSKDGLTMFKKGWASETRDVYFCGRILSKKYYDELVQKRCETDSDFFPVYRGGRFSF